MGWGHSPGVAHCVAVRKRIMGLMKLRIFTEPQQGATYDDLLTVAQATERLGFDAFFRSDHYMRIGEGEPAPVRPTPGSRWPRSPGRPPRSGSARW